MSVPSFKQTDTHERTRAGNDVRSEREKRIPPPRLGMSGEIVEAVIRLSRQSNHLNPQVICSGTRRIRAGERVEDEQQWGTWRDVSV